MEDHPVSGVSWYEAKAYAKFAGKSLPTLPHWFRAASIEGAGWIAPASNFSGRSTVAAGSTGAMSAFGIHDVAGNVREWTLNATGRERFIVGGSYNDPPYTFGAAGYAPPFDRSPGNGIRLVKYEDGDDIDGASAAIERVSRDISTRVSVSDEVFDAYLQLFSYDKTPLDPVVKERMDEGGWTRELVRVNAAYPADSLLLYLYLPKKGPGPHPVVVYFPGSNATWEAVPMLDASQNIEFIVKSGRALLLPIYKGTYQRRLRDGAGDFGSTAYRDHVVMMGKDLRRAIDYLETRKEVTLENLAYYGVSWGGRMGGLLPAIEPRIKSSVLVVAGLSPSKVRPEIDPINYLPRIRVPTVMIAGRYDFFFPLTTAQEPMFRLLGTPPEHKRHAVEEGSHYVPRVIWVRETLNWLDRYQPVPE
jgi:dienelactone hydrolase